MDANTSEEWKAYLMSVKSDVDETYRSLMSSEMSLDDFIRQLVISETYLQLIDDLSEKRFPNPFINYLRNNLLDNFGAMHNVVSLSKNQRGSNSLYYMPPELCKRYHESFYTVKSWFDKLREDGHVAF